MKDGQGQNFDGHCKNKVGIGKVTKIKQNTVEKRTNEKGHLAPEKGKWESQNHPGKEKESARPRKGGKLLKIQYRRW